MSNKQAISKKDELNMFGMPEGQGLYRADFEHTSCGIGFVANLKGRKKHAVITDALDMLERMEHRGGTGFDVKSGDGAGILFQIPHELFMEECPKQGIKLPKFGEYGVGMTFFPKDKIKQSECKEIIERNLKKMNLPLLGYRIVPVDNSDLGRDSAETEPSVQQIFIAKPEGMDASTFDRKLFVFRKYSERVCNETVAGIGPDGLNIISCSYKTINYKGQLVTEQVPKYFLDLQNETAVSAIALVHSRFSTNTFPSWKLAQPFRYIAHNGEINTNKGNINWMRAREILLECTAFSKEELEMIFPICDPAASDSANLDMAIEMLVLSGRSLPHVLMMLIPEAWQNDPDMDPAKRAFYEFYSAMMEPWDGPASVCFTDGVLVGATLDRNGLRPSRYCVTDDDMLIMASETGVIDVDHNKVKIRGRLQPGKMFVADLEKGRIISDDELKADLCSRQPYQEWINQTMVHLDDLPAPEDFELKTPKHDVLFRRQQTFGFTYEDITEILKPMATGGKEPLGSMGADNPLAVLSDRPVQLSHYFKQLFAQVTNPPIDSIRERVVMDLRTYVGGFKNVLTESPEHCRRIAIPQPVLTNEDLSKLIHVDTNHFQTKRLDIVFPATGKPGVLEKTLDRICRYAEDAIDEGYSIILLSDFAKDTDHAPIPSVLAAAAVHHYLIRAGKRGKADIILEVGDVREVHHFATVLGYGASAINPYMALDTIRDMEKEDLLNGLDANTAISNYIKAIDGGLLKIFSKMGISTLASYQGAQIFEIVGINSDVVEKYFTGTVSRIEGLSLDDIAKETLQKHRKGFPARGGAAKVLDPGGEYHWRKDGERHLFNPTTIRLLQECTRDNDYEKYKEYSKAVNDQNKAAFTLRGLMEFSPDRKPISIDEVEPAENILKRFATGAMSFGSISWEAHTTLAIAMNRIGSRSNSGEGGEDPKRYTKLPNGDDMCSATKQIASGRFGVNSYYLSKASELQIKMAQGAKPGEGGHLPGHKVNGWIGRTRGSTPGVGLISPPPHHDIYSIEDLAQLIYDLKNSNRDARVNVKLVSEAGVGTIAAGVCKAKADAVLIAGYDGGTGASPLSSIKHAGLPWELGLSETHQTLVRNRLRNRIVVQADGQMKTSRDLAIATLLGAEEWGVATAALVVQGCIMMRKCHSNTCPVGIATQRGELRAKFTGNPDHVVNFFEFLVDGLREIMAELGFRTIDEMVGQSQVLKFRDNVDHWKYKNLDLSPILHKETIGAEEGGTYHCKSQNHMLESVIDWKLIDAAKGAIENGESASGEFDVINTDRSVGTILSNELTKATEGKGLPDGTIKFKLNGSIGQSMGAFMCKGIELELEGDANDYVGKGLSGGQLAIYPSKGAPFAAEENILVGNVCFYGATAGKAYIRGVAGERFCVRNSGAEVVVEGIGDHGCEYMTGGKAIILGRTGRNFGAGMSGGVAYVYDVDGDFAEKCNMEMIELEKVHVVREIEDLKAMITVHQQKTGSTVAAAMLADWDDALAKFVKVIPTDYKRMLEYIEQARDTGEYETEEQIIDAAFDMHIASLNA
ncbi:glutamate synthase large subunit [Pontiella sp. NLcol2]|uniref:Glutamate synthase large subunit n=2 Tax=Pontiella agarivorans TaxID=3038953 RepID=A0ABU5MV85_9BACT|nr:glutamate synthase large subunit [Pontiella agarivorans]MDZ8118124.1 glutamate synthase large subunit [Pontiella agarivorans]